MPPKRKQLYKEKGKLTSLPKPKPVVSSLGSNNGTTGNNSTVENSGNETAGTSNNNEVQQQFEVELYWCIQQLQKSLSSSNLNQKQIQDATKSLKILTSKNTSIVQKRQTMRLTFGDYRKKMQDEEKKLKKVQNNMYIKELTPSTQSTFVKKSAFTKSNPNFKFDFNTSEENKDDEVENKQVPEEKICSEIEKLDIKINDTNKFRYQPSDNTFKFNFSIEK